MKRALLAVLLTIMFCGAALADAAWETGRMPYKPSLKGSVCWTGMRQYKDDNRKEMLFHSMDLSTGKISTRELGDWYLIQTDLARNGTLIARQSEGMLQIARYSKDGTWKPFLEYPYDNDYRAWNPNYSMYHSRSVLAYLDGCLYYLMSDGEREWIRRDDMKGNVHDYSTGNDASCISGSGCITGTDSQNDDFIETIDGSIFMIGRNDDKRRSYFPIAWLDDDRLLLWVRELDDNWAEYLYEYRYQDDTFTPVYNDKGEHILCETGSMGYSASINPDNGQIVQLVLWAEGYYDVPAVLKRSDGKPVFIAETQHTKTYDEYCTSIDRVIWLVAG